MKFIMYNVSSHINTKPPTLSVAPMLSSVFILMVTPLEITPGGPSHKWARMTLRSNVREQIRHNYCHCWRVVKRKVCRTVISLPTHSRPESES